MTRWTVGNAEGVGGVEGRVRGACLLSTYVLLAILQEADLKFSVCGDCNAQGEGLGLHMGPKSA